LPERKKKERRNNMQIKFFRRFFSLMMMVMFFGVFSPAVTVPSQAADEAEAQAIIDKAQGTLANFMRDQKYSWLHQQLKTVRGVIIFPQIVKGGFFLGGSGGTGVFLARDASNNWSQPAFYTLGSVTFGLQIGGEAAEVIMLVNSEKGVTTLMTSSVRLGGDASIAAGPVGGGAKGAVAVPTVTADFISFARSKGLYAGLNLEGAVLAVRDSLNEAYYGKKVSPSEIVSRKGAGNAGANELRSALKRASTRGR
jgi:lipid-binding SYLF domain-containing protein